MKTTTENPYGPRPEQAITDKPRTEEPSEPEIEDHFIERSSPDERKHEPYPVIAKFHYDALRKYWSERCAGLEAELREVQSYLLEHDHEFLEANPGCKGCQLQERIAAHLKAKGGE